MIDRVETLSHSFATWPARSVQEWAEGARERIKAAQERKIQEYCEGVCESMNRSLLMRAACWLGLAEPWSAVKFRADLEDPGRESHGFDFDYIGYRLAAYSYDEWLLFVDKIKRVAAAKLPEEPVYLSQDAFYAITRKYS